MGKNRRKEGESNSPNLGNLQDVYGAFITSIATVQKRNFDDWVGEHSGEFIEGAKRCESHRLLNVRGEDGRVYIQCLDCGSIQITSVME